MYLNFVLTSDTDDNEPKLCRRHELGGVGAAHRSPVAGGIPPAHPKLGDRQQSPRKRRRRSSFFPPARECRFGAENLANENTVRSSSAVHRRGNGPAAAPGGQAGGQAAAGGQLRPHQRTARQLRGAAYGPALAERRGQPRRSAEIVDTVLLLDLPAFLQFCRDRCKYRLAGFDN
jgi:hypothetical protein